MLTHPLSSCELGVWELLQRSSVSTSLGRKCNSILSMTDCSVRLMESFQLWSLFWQHKKWIKLLSLLLLLSKVSWFYTLKVQNFSPGNLSPGVPLQGETLSSGVRTKSGAWRPGDLSKLFICPCFIFQNKMNVKGMVVPERVNCQPSGPALSDWQPMTI